MRLEWRFLNQHSFGTWISSYFDLAFNRAFLIACAIAIA